jgi:hypothetical protein
MNGSNTELFLITAGHLFEGIPISFEIDDDTNFLKKLFFFENIDYLICDCYYDINKPPRNDPYDCMSHKDIALFKIRSF